jgi:hypothetical protein
LHSLSQVKVALPSFLTIALMPMSHSISNGIWFGLGAAAVLSLATHDAWGALFAPRAPQERGGLWSDDGDDETDALLDGGAPLGRGARLREGV